MSTNETTGREDSSIPRLHIGSESEFVAIQVRREHGAEAWVVADCVIQVRGFTGSISAYFEPLDFEQFTSETEALYETCTGRAALRPCEQQLTLSLTGNGRGGVEVCGEAWSQACYENKLEFTFEIDQTFLPATIAQLRSLNRALGKTSSE